METIALRCEDAALDIAPQGAEPRAWRVAGQELLWNGDPAIWPKTAPVLFPVVGWTRDAEIRHQGQSYPMGVHGFAAGSRFSLASQAPDRAEFLLQDSPASRAHYPFAFQLTLRYRLRPRGFSARFILRNTDDAPLPYALGLHPGFRWDPRQPGQALHFGREETPAVPVIAPGGLFDTARRPVPLAGRHLPLSTGLLAQEALCFLDLRSRSLRFDRGDGSRISMWLGEMPHLAIWTLPNAPFLCLEAWTGHGDPVGFTGEIADKPSMRLLPPGGVAQHLAGFSVALG